MANTTTHTLTVLGSCEKVQCTLTLAERRALRALAHAPNYTKVSVVLGGQEPAVTGQSFYWETRGGTCVKHPAAYAKKGWSNLRYVCSTYSVEVGIDWLNGWKAGRSGC